MVQALLSAVDVLGVRIHDVTEDEALALLERFVEEGVARRVVTPNPEIVMLARRDPGYRALLNRSDLAIPDGIGLLLAARANGHPLRAHVRGTDLVRRLARRSAERGWRWFLVGGRPGVAEAAAARLGQDFPKLQIAGTYAGAPDPSEDRAIREQIAASGEVQVLLVAYGGGAQERWIERNQAATGVPVQMGVGGVLDFLSGQVPRAPEWVRRLELEWAYRLAKEPWRWRRQLALPAFAVLAATEALRKRRAGE
ncbi:MAG: glycosyltransferase [Chloroflexi bacterium]|nr:glycosyltransferase [Chloroflexota bacterium]